MRGVEEGGTSERGSYGKEMERERIGWRLRGERRRMEGREEEKGGR